MTSYRVTRLQWVNQSSTISTSFIVTFRTWSGILGQMGHGTKRGHARFTSFSLGKFQRRRCLYGNGYSCVTWWRHQMETFSALLAICAENSPVPGEFPAQRPATRSFDAFFDLRPNKRLSKQSWGWWSETPSSSLWRHRAWHTEVWLHIIPVPKGKVTPVISM